MEENFFHRQREWRNVRIAYLTGRYLAPIFRLSFIFFAVYAVITLPGLHRILAAILAILSGAYLYAIYYKSKVELFWYWRLAEELGIDLGREMERNKLCEVGALIWALVKRIRELEGKR